MQLSVVPVAYALQTARLGRADDRACDQPALHACGPPAALAGTIVRPRAVVPRVGAAADYSPLRGALLHRGLRMRGPQCNGERSGSRCNALRYVALRCNALRRVATARVALRCNGVNGGEHLHTLQHTNGLCALVMSADMFPSRMGRRAGGKRGRPGRRASVGGRGRVHDI